MKKFHYVLTSLFSLSTVLAVADQAAQQPVESVVTQPTSVITPAVAPVVDGAGFFFTADFIWWKATMGGAGYAATGIADNGANVPLFTSTRSGKIKGFDFDFQPGFKVGAGLNLQHDGWDLYANYTWLFGERGHNSINSKPGLGETSSILTAYPSGALANTPIVSASSTWKENFNVLDTELGRNYFISHRLTLRPFFGLKAAWIDERLDVHLLTTNLNAFLGNQVFRIHQHRSQDMWGLGIRGGLNTAWHFCKNWGFYGNLAFTTLWSDFHTRATDEFTNTASGVEFDTVRTSIVITEVNMVIESGLGLTYMTWFNDDKCQFTLRAGWEEQIWFNMNHFTDQTKTGNLTLHGLTVHAGIGF